jgi:predicted RNA-binding protein Jag
MIEMREFVGDDLEGAVEKAAKHFGVPANRLETSVLSGRVQISGIGNRVLVLATVREAPVELGPVGTFLRELLERMRVGGQIGIEEHEEESEIVLRLRGDRIRELMQRDKRIRGALTHLVTRAAQRLIGPDAAARVDLENGEHRDHKDQRDQRGHREHRERGERRDEPDEERLEELARSRAREARSKGQEVLLPPMNSRERWIVHNSLKTESGIRTASVGEGRLKRVKIVPI